MRIDRVMLSAMLLAALPGAVVAQEYRYAVFELPRLTDTYQWAGAVDVNSHGDTVGFTSTTDNAIHAVLWPRDGGVVDLGTLGGRYSGAQAINGNREICGWAADPEGNLFDTRAFLWRDGQMIDLGTLGGEESYAFALNDSGQIVGEAGYNLKSGRQRAFLWTNGEMEELPGINPELGSRVAFGINNSGEIVGTGYDQSLQIVGLFWRNREVFELESLGGDGSTQANAISDAGVIVGGSVTSTDWRHAVKWVDGQIIDVHTYNVGLTSVARGINNLGQIVGDTSTLSGRALILNPGEEMLLLDDLVPPRLRLDWTMQRATHINDAGQIPVTADFDGDTWALLLTPVDATMTLQGPAPGRAGTTNGLRVNGATPGARVTFLYSRHGGGTRISGCDLQQNALQLDNPTVIGSAIADANGVATITRTVPLVARGQTILFQAVVQGECSISQLVVHEFE